MAITIISKSDRMIVLKGKISEDGDEADQLCAEMTTPESRVRTVSNMALVYFKIKGVSIDAHRLDRSVKIVRKKWRS